MFSWLRFFIALVVVLPVSAFADDSLNWRCWYDQQVHITCLIDNVPTDNAGAAQLALPENLPAIVKQMRNDPAAFRNRVVQIPLHSEPLDMEFTALLAKSAVCGSRRDCTVHFTATPATTTEIVALLRKHQPATQPRDTTLLAMATLDNDD